MFLVKIVMMCFETNKPDNEKTEKDGKFNAPFNIV